MDKTGITRRIDELGRIVIPKEIRKNLRIKNSDELEVRVVDNNIVLSKFDGLIADKIIHSVIYAIYKETGNNILFTSKEKIIDYVGKEKNKHILNEKVISIIEERINYLDSVKLFDDNEIYNCYLLPIIINGDLFGSLIMYSLTSILDKDKIIMQFCSRFLTNYLE